MIFHGLPRRLAAAWAGDRKGPLANDLLQRVRRPRHGERGASAPSASDGTSGGPGCNSCTRYARNASVSRAAVRRHPDLERELQSYHLAPFGDRCMEELKLESMTLHDDPTPSLRAVGYYACCLDEHTAREKERTDTKVREQAELHVRRALGRPTGCGVWSFCSGAAFDSVSGGVQARENLRALSAHVSSVAPRQILPEIGMRFAAIDCVDSPRDIVHLELDEALGFVEGRVTTTDLKG